MDKAWWFAARVVAIFGHLVLGVAGMVLAINYEDGWMDGNVSWSEHNADSSVLNACAPVGFMGAAFNLAIFFFLQIAGRVSGRESHFCNQATALIGGLITVGFIVGDLALAASLGSRDQPPFGALSVVTAVAAILLSLAVIADTVKHFKFDVPDADEDRLMYDFQRADSPYQDAISNDTDHEEDATGTG
ncbi:Uu.00g061610.m01.CDS01 [Anthostomella pinea]|uniref:Uu.00g061610.m01.CDS01 n=1 Tax=Anthostomella pinea TaxID=933095 RepID=A0AAI8YK58_9PEZI|nr:Uu.00g061610.m01.CDS01 [Anthostomella pinea]